MNAIDTTRLDSWLFDVRNGHHLTEDIIRERLEVIERDAPLLVWDHKDELCAGLLSSLAYHAERTLGETEGLR